MLISVIVPIYNTEKYLKNCIKSILNQTYKELELILIDDGSQDGSGDICDRYAMIDKRVIVVHQGNSGVSVARNRGIDIANGDYITFVDSDDWLEENTFKILTELLKSNNSDMIVSNAYFRNEKDLRFIGIPGNRLRYTAEEAKDLLLKFQFSTSLCMCLYSKSIIKGAHLNESIHFWEDLEYQYRVICKADKIAVNTTPLYHYREGSITHNTLNERKLTCLKIPEILKSSINMNNKYNNNLILNLEVSFLFDLAILGARDINHNIKCDNVIQRSAKKLLSYVWTSKSYKTAKRIYLLFLSVNPKLYYYLFCLKYKIIREEIYE